MTTNPGYVPENFDTYDRQKLPEKYQVLLQIEELTLKIHD